MSSPNLASERSAVNAAGENANPETDPRVFVLVFPSEGTMRGAGKKWKHYLDPVERAFLQYALFLTRGNRKKAAQLLGMHRATLFAKMREHGIPKIFPTTNPLV